MDKENEAPAAKRHALSTFYQQKSELVTVEYTLALLAAVLATMLVVDGFGTLFSLWSGATVGSSTLSGLFVAGTASAAFSAVLIVTAAFVLSVSSLILFKRACIAIRDRVGYTSRLAYRLPTYAALIVVAAQLLFIVITLVAVMITSLALLGSDSIQVSQLYSRVFLPSLLAGGVVAAVGYCLYRIIKGRNFSRMLSMLLVGVSLVLLIATIITVAAIGHDTATPQLSPFGSNNSRLR